MPCGPAHRPFFFEKLHHPLFLRTLSGDEKPLRGHPFSRHASPLSPLASRIVAAASLHRGDVALALAAPPLPLVTAPRAELGASEPRHCSGGHPPAIVTRKQPMTSLQQPIVASSSLSVHLLFSRLHRSIPLLEASGHVPVE